jgi:hypothetical protein
VKTGAKLVTAVRVFVNPVVYSAHGVTFLSFLFYAHCQSKHFSMRPSPAAALIGSARSTQPSSLFQPMFKLAVAAWTVDNVFIPKRDEQQRTAIQTRSAKET